MVTVMLIAGCAGTLKDYGTYAPDTEITQLFASGSPSTLYQYYFSGPASGPTAILGINKTYLLEERLWQKIDPNSDAYGKLLEGMQNRTLRLGLSLKGYTLFAPDKTPVGIWYSVFQATPVVHMLGDRIVEVLGPPTDLYERYEDNNVMSR
jgi:hypothetical protein